MCDTARPNPPFVQQLEDLLDFETIASKPLRVVDAPKKRLGTMVHGLREVEVNDVSEVMEFIDKAEEKVKRASTKMNKQSK